LYNKIGAILSKTTRIESTPSEACINSKSINSANKSEMWYTFSNGKAAFPGLRASDDKPSSKNTGKAEEIVLPCCCHAAQFVFAI